MKNYVKPELVYESFELTQQIASCQFDSNSTANDEDCQFYGWDEVMQENITIFKSNCTDVTKNEWVVESFCYHNASEGQYGIFNS